MTTIREDRLDDAIRRELRSLELTPDSTEEMRAQWQAGSIVDDISVQRRSLAAKIEDRHSKISRLADLLIDQAIDKVTYDTKKKELGFELSQLQGQFDDLPNPKDIRHNREEYINRMKQLLTTYDLASVTEKRQMLRNTFASRHADQQRVQLKVRTWVGVHCTPEPKKSCRKVLV